MQGDLEAVGLHEGEAVRWRRHDGGHWQAGTVIGLERDGSVAVRDGDGAWRSILPDRLEARRPGAETTLQSSSTRGLKASTSRACTCGGTGS